MIVLYSKYVLPTIEYTLIEVDCAAVYKTLLFYILAERVVDYPKVTRSTLQVIDIVVVDDIAQAHPLKIMHSVVSSMNTN